jgi:DNA replication and repair protein RecF
VRIGALGFVVDGFYANTHLQFYFSPRRKKLALDSVVQTSAAQYLEVGRAVWFSNGDLVIAKGPAEERRRYLDFVAAQLDPSYRRHLRAYEKALRSRNYLLKAATVRWREVAAFDEPLLAAGNALTAARAALVLALQPHAMESHKAISGEAGEELTVGYEPGAGDDFAQRLAETRDESLRLRQTLVGPHRDEVALRLNGRTLDLASEGQQRTVALALRLAQARLIAVKVQRLPLLLLDDIFGELDPARRNALLRHLPEGAQQIITTTHLDWVEGAMGQVFRLG